MKNNKKINQTKLNELKKIRENLLKYVNESKDYNLRSLSKTLGRNDAYLQQYIKRGSPNYLPEEERSHLCKILKLNFQALTPLWLRIKSKSIQNLFKIKKTDKRFIFLPKEFFEGIQITKEDNLFFYEFNLNDVNENKSIVKVIVDIGVNHFENNNEYILNDRDHLFLANLSIENKDYIENTKKINVKPLQKQFGTFRIYENKIKVFGKIIFRSQNIYNE